MGTKDEFLVGRQHEMELIRQAQNSERSELGIIYGRRRIGKSFLLRRMKRGTQDLYFEGLQGGDTKTQIKHFLKQLKEQLGGPHVIANSWAEAFDHVSTFFKAPQNRFVVFDEFPWMACEKPALVSLFKYYWDNKWKENPALKMFLCGSVASFMLKHLVHSKALHNRKTFELHLEPLPMHEAKDFFREKRSLHEISKFLMIFGGVPKYLEQVDSNKSLSLNMDKLCFEGTGFFVNEFETLFKEQFKVSKSYELIVRAIAKGHSKKIDISKYTRIEPGGGLSSYLKTLENAGFIRAERALSVSGGLKAKTLRYSLWDEWLRFYLTFMDKNLPSIQINRRSGLFEQITKDKLEVFFGLAFERLCAKNISHLLECLEIPLSEVRAFGPFFKQGSRHRAQPPLKGKPKVAPGLQIDLLILRRGNVLSLVECKYRSQPIGLEIIPEIESKIAALGAPQKLTIEKILVSSSGITRDLAATSYFHRIIGLEELFSSKLP